MIASLLSGISLGFGAAVPLGPINILIMTNALRSYKSAVAIGLGAMSADLSYFILLYFLGAKIAKYPLVSKLLALFGALFLLYIAWLIFQGRNNPIQKLTTQTNFKDLAKSYLKGFSLTLLNPYTIAFWLSVTSLIATTHLHPIYTIAGIILAILSWITLMPLIIHKTKHLISQKINWYFSILSASIMLFFAISLLLDNFF